MFEILEKDKDYAIDEKDKNFDYESDLKNNYITPGHPIAFSGINNIYNLLSIFFENVFICL
jgi:hypothetical protein